MPDQLGEPLLHLAGLPAIGRQQAPVAVTPSRPSSALSRTAVAFLFDRSRRKRDSAREPLDFDC
jgi:hypothetical protein